MRSCATTRLLRNPAKTGNATIFAGVQGSWENAQVAAFSVDVQASNILLARTSLSVGESAVGSASCACSRRVRRNGSRRRLMSFAMSPVRFVFSALHKGTIPVRARLLSWRGSFWSAFVIRRSLDFARACRMQRWGRCWRPTWYPARGWAAACARPTPWGRPASSSSASRWRAVARLASDLSRITGEPVDFGSSGDAAPGQAGRGRAAPLGCGGAAGGASFCRCRHSRTEPRAASARAAVFRRTRPAEPACRYCRGLAT